MTTAHTDASIYMTPSEQAAQTSMALEGRAVPVDYEPSEIERHLLNQLIQARS